MIRFDLKCSADHRFDSWFKSGAAFDSIKATGLLTCPVCGSDDVDKAMMAPPLAKAATARMQAADTGTDTGTDTDTETTLARMRREVEENADYVGLQFATQARKMHNGDTPNRPIYGEAKPEEARKLIEDGVPVLPLPFIPKRKTN